MKKYRIEVSGKGGESYIFKLTDEQKQKLHEGNVISDEMESDEIADVLEVNDVYDTDDIILGVYPNLIYIEVFNENNDKIWSSGDKFEMVSDDIEYLYDEPNILIVEDYVKGHFFTYDLEIEEEFDPKHLSPVIVSLSETIEIIRDLKYNNFDLRPFKDYGDYWSKGLTYYLF